MWRVGVDVGGTFTDVFAYESASGRTVAHKTPTTPDDPSRGVADGLAALRERFDVNTSDISEFCHGTTIATNALIQRRGGRIVLVTTRGFADLLTIGRQVRPLIYDLQADYPEPLIPPDLRFEIDERIGSKGEVLTTLTDREMKRVVREVSDINPDGVAVCHLFAFLNPDHEQRIAEALRDRLPGVPVSTSHEVQPVFREYERFSTTVLNAYLQPVMSNYIHALGRVVAAESPNADIGINQSSGSLMSLERAERFPVRTTLSGPAAGVVGAIDSGGRSGRRMIITLDVGGTSTDVSLVRDAAVPVTYHRNVAGFPVRLPSVDVNAVGAGGGSLIQIGADGLMTVGPDSAGADPGPACYGRGGNVATVTDANLVLGRLPTTIAGGDMALDAGLARDAMRPLAGAFNVSIEEAAAGALRIVASNMVRAIRAVSVERGRDPRRAVLVPYGGAGGLHAIEVAEALDIGTILVPPDPGILCARGLMVADRSEVFLTARLMPLDGNETGILTLFVQLQSEASGWLQDQPGAGLSEASLDLRFVGQNYELTIPVDDTDDWFERAKISFWEEHERAYGHADRDMPIEVVNVRVTARVAAEPLLQPDRPSASPMAHDWPKRDIWFEGTSPLPASVVNRAELATVSPVAGPAVVEQDDATTLIWPGWIGCVDDAANLMLEKTR